MLWNGLWAEQTELNETSTEYDAEYSDASAYSDSPEYSDDTEYSGGAEYTGDENDSGEDSVTEDPGLCLGTASSEEDSIFQMVAGVVVTNSSSVLQDFDCEMIFSSEEVFQFEQEWFTRNVITMLSVSAEEICNQNYFYIKLNDSVNFGDSSLKCNSFGGTHLESEYNISSSEWDTTCPEDTFSWIGLDYVYEDLKTTKCSALHSNGTIEMKTCAYVSECILCKIPQMKRYTLYGNLSRYDIDRYKTRS